MDNKEKTSILKRLGDAVSYVVAGVTPNSWMGPNQPIAPVAQENAKGRQFDYPIATNLHFKPKTNEGVQYSDLRNIADKSTLVRLCIETRKDQLSRFKWGFKLKGKDKNKARDSRCDELENFFAFPDKELNFDEWIRKITEDLLVVDAPCIYPVLTNVNKPYAFEVIDGTTIKKIIDDTGRTPSDDNSVAFQQYLKGFPAVDYNRNELVFKPRNIRSNKLYGFSPVEQILTTINIHLRKEINQLSYFTDGNVPNLLIKVPENYTPDQLAKYAKYWEEMNNGVNKHQAKFLPGGFEPYDVKPVELKNELDEWVARQICFAFSISPSALVKDNNRATAQTSAKNSQEEGLYPLLEWFRNFINLLVVKYFEYQDIEFFWETEPETDPLIKVDIDTKYVAAGVLTADEVRKTLGYEPLPKMEVKPELQIEDSTKKKLLLKGINKENINEDEEVINMQEAIAIILLYYFELQRNTLLLNIPSNLNKFTSIINTELNIDDKNIISIYKELDSKYQIIADKSVNNTLKTYDLKDVDVVNNSITQSNLYAKRRSAELIGKRIKKDGSIIDNPNSNFCINDTTRDNIEDLINKAINDGWSNQQLRDELMSNYNFSKERAMMIARTETNMADNNITLKTFESAGIKKKKWLTANDDRVEQHCIENESQGAIDIQASFKNGGVAPPAHPNCRCTILAVFDNYKE